MQRPPTPPLYKSPLPFHIHLSTWKSSEIASFLTLHRLPHHAKSFENNDITGAVILELGADELKELGVNKVGERVRILGAIKDLKRRSAASLAGISAGSVGPGGGSLAGGGRDREGSVSGSLGVASSSTPGSASSFTSVHQNQQASYNNGGSYHGGGTSRARSDRSGSESEMRGTVDNGTQPGPPVNIIDYGHTQHAHNANIPTSPPSRSDSPATHTLDRSRQQSNGTSGSVRRLNAYRPPPLDLHSTSHGHSASGGSGSNSGAVLENGQGAQLRRAGSMRNREAIAAAAAARENANSGGHGMHQQSHPGVTPRGGIPNSANHSGSAPLSSTHTIIGPPTGSGSSAEWLNSSTNSNPGSTANSANISPLARSSSLRGGKAVYPPGVSAGATQVPGPQAASSAASTARLRAPLPSSAPYGNSPPGSTTTLAGRRSPSPAIPGGVGGHAHTSPAVAARKGSPEFAARPLPGLPPEEGYGAGSMLTEEPEDLGRRYAGGVPMRVGGSFSGISNVSGSGNGSGAGQGSRSLEVRPQTSSGSVGGLAIPFGQSHRRNESATQSQAVSHPGRSLSSQGEREMARRRATNQRPSTSGASASVHPYAATAPRPIKIPSPTTKTHTSPTKNRNVEPGSQSSWSENRGDLTPTNVVDARSWHNSPGKSPIDDSVYARAQRRGMMADRKLGLTDKQPSLTPPPTSEELKRKLIKFHMAEDNSSRTIDVDSCQDGFEVVEKALRKFNKWRGAGKARPPLADSESDGDDVACLDVDGWGVFLDKSESARALSEGEILAVCYAAPSDPTRENGLWLKRMRHVRRKDIEGFFGDMPPSSLMSPTSPTYTVQRRDSPKSGSPSHATHSGKKMHRASTVSVLSALGVPNSDAPPRLPEKAAIPKSPSSGSFLGARGKKMYNFFGHRPSSELIATHLVEYFPAAKKKDLEKGWRNSMLRLGGGDGDAGRRSMDSRRSSTETNRMPSRFSMASSKTGSDKSTHRKSMASSFKASTPPSAVILEEQGDIEPVPKLSISTDDDEDIAPAIDGEQSQPRTRNISGPPLLPALHGSGESLSDSLKVYEPQARPTSYLKANRRNSAASGKSRHSIVSQRRPRPKSEATSLLTVDEITAEVENRRASVITFAASEDEAEAAEEQLLAPGGAGLSKAYSPGLVPTEGDESDEDQVGEEEEEESDGEYEEDSEEESEEEEEEEEEEDEEEQEELSKDEAEHGKAFMSTGSKRAIKWIKGALIGSGSFGKVYLGMDAHNGLLMAVKQVDLDMVGSAEKKQSMVTAMQQEISLLKELQHDNIVQYLDSSTDEHNLNIFLEYVPGGSVTALLRNYGAFEEALVKTFVRQILTGLEYLHDRDIIHRDIKGANILVDNKGGVKISDFGISKKVGNNFLSSMRLNRASLQGSVFWMAPEVVQQTAYTKKADIWSVGCLVVEMLTGEHPWPDLTQMQAIFRIGSSAKPNIPSDISTEAADMLAKTFVIDYKQRPEAKELLGCGFLSVGK